MKREEVGVNISWTLNITLEDGGDYNEQVQIQTVLFQNTKNITEGRSVNDNNRGIDQLFWKKKKKLNGT